jgi:hypothetical protein
VGGRTDFLRPFIWSRVTGLMRFRDGSNKETASNFVQSSENLGRRPWQWEESMSRIRKVQIHRGRKWPEKWKSKVKSILIIFFDIKGIVHKEFALADQTVIFVYYCDVLRRLRENV